MGAMGTFGGPPGALVAGVYIGVDMTVGWDPVLPVLNPGQVGSGYTIDRAAHPGYHGLRRRRPGLPVSMLRLWRWTYAREYLRSKRTWGTADTPAWTAVCGVSLVMAANLLALAFVVTRIAGVPFADSEYKPYLVVAALLLLYMNYRRFIRNGDADDLIRELERQSRRETRREERMLLLYELSSLFGPFVLMALGLAFKK